MRKPKIFNHDIMTCTHEAVVGNYLYCGRILGMSEPDDIVQLHPQLRSEWSAISAHYDRIGLPHSQNIIWDVSLNVLTEYPDYDVSVFYFGDSLSPHSPTHEWFRRLDQRWVEVVEQTNCKNGFIRLATELGVPVPQTFCFSSKFEVQFAAMPYPCYLKPAVSVNGVGICRCEDALALQQALAELADDLPLQIQQEIIATTFLNVQYRICDQQAERLAITEQILEGCAHIGNRYPARHQPWELFDPLANWMAEQGMRGIFAFDVAVAETAAGPQYFAIECNPRFNGASYPTGIAEKLNLTQWANESFKTTCRSLHQLDLSGLEYDACTGSGVILVNWGSILVGKIGVLMAGSLDQQQQLREHLKQRLAQPQRQQQLQMV
jgi:ATP-grasp domain